MGHVSYGTKEHGLLTRPLLDQGKVTVRPGALTLGPGQSFWCTFHPPPSGTSQTFPSLPLMPSPAFPRPHSPFAQSYLLTVHFLPSLMCFCLPFCCFQVVVICSSQQPPALSSVFLHHLFSLNWPFNSHFFAVQQLGHLSHLHSRTPITHRQCRQTAPAEFCHGFASSQ